MKIKWLLYIFISSLVIFSCRKEEYISSKSANLRFSLDTVFFDTVFTTVGSTTKILKVYNPHSEWVKISDIYISGGDASNYRMAVDGEPGNHIRNVEIAPKDSMYVFVEVTVDPNNTNSPLVVQDSIIFNTNENEQNVKLVAWGQDVYIIRGQNLATQTWTGEKPYLIIDSVIVDHDNTLTIEAGATVYFHKQAVMLMRGSLLVEGELGSPVVFRGDRLDDAISGIPYDKLPEQWGGILFDSISVNNDIRYAVIKNGIIGLFVYYGASLNLENTIIDNQAFAGIYALGAGISAKNCLISNCGYYNIVLACGGLYEFLHCSIVNYYSFSFRQTPAIAITNYIVQDDSSILAQNLEMAYFGNCIVYGTNQDEVGLGELDDVVFNYYFNHCIVRYENRQKLEVDESRFINVIFDEEPAFKSLENYNYNFELDTLSVGKDAGLIDITNSGPVLQTDILGNSRLSDDGPDIGVYERIEE